MATFDEEEDYLEAEDEHLNDIVSFSSDVQFAIDQVRKCSWTLCNCYF